MMALTANTHEPQAKPEYPPPGPGAHSPIPGAATDRHSPEFEDRRSTRHAGQRPHPTVPPVPSEPGQQRDGSVHRLALAAQTRGQNLQNRGCLEPVPNKRRLDQPAAMVNLRNTRYPGIGAGHQGHPFQPLVIPHDLAHWDEMAHRPTRSAWSPSVRDRLGPHRSPLPTHSMPAAW